MSAVRTGVRAYMDATPLWKVQVPVFSAAKRLRAEVKLIVVRRIWNPDASMHQILIPL